MDICVKSIFTCRQFYAMLPEIAPGSATEFKACTLLGPLKAVLPWSKSPVRKCSSKNSRRLSKMAPAHR